MRAAGHRQDAQVDEVAQHVEKKHYSRANGKAQGKIASRVLNFACGEGDVIPGICTEEAAHLHHGDHRKQAHKCRRSTDADLHSMLCVPSSIGPEIVPVGAEVRSDGSGILREYTHEHHGGKRENLGACKHVLNAGAKLYTEGVEER